MQVVKPVGRGASARKYDILSALMTHALALGGIEERRVMRFMSLITARYNWQRDELSTGQREIARMWSVDERTVKREMARFRASGWLVQKRRGSRGRISLYGIDLEKVLEDTRACWPLIGEDFVSRMDVGAASETSNVVPLRSVAPVVTGDAWSRTQALLHAEDPAIYAAWFHVLVEAERGEGRLVLSAPSGFHAAYVETHFLGRLRSAARAADPGIADVRVIS